MGPERVIDALMPGTTAKSLSELIDDGTTHRVSAADPQTLASLMPASATSIEGLMREYAQRGGDARILRSYEHGGREQLLGVRGIPPQHLVEFYHAGFSVCMDHAHKVFRSMWKWTSALEVALHAAPGCVHVNAYASTRGSGLSMHFDSHPVIVVQMIGTKTWLVKRNETVQAPQVGWNRTRPLKPELNFADLERSPMDMAGAETIAMTPGTTLFLPTGYWHATCAHDEPSLSFTLGLSLPRYYEVVVAAIERALKSDARWRQEIVASWGQGGERGRAIEELAKLRPLLANTVGALDPEAVLGDYVRGSTREELATRYGERLQYVCVGEASAVDVGGAELTVRVTDRHGDTVEVTLPTECGPVVETVVQQQSYFSENQLVKELPALEPRLVLDTLSLLVQAGLVSD